jgi:hypothetical protein
MRGILRTPIGVTESGRFIMITEGIADLWGAILEPNGSGDDAALSATFQVVEDMLAGLHVPGTFLVSKCAEKGGHAHTVVL